MAKRHTPNACIKLGVGDQGELTINGVPAKDAVSSFLRGVGLAIQQSLFFCNYCGEGDRSVDDRWCSARCRCLDAVSREGGCLTIRRGG